MQDGGQENKKPLSIFSAPSIKPKSSRPLASQMVQINTAFKSKLNMHELGNTKSTQTFHLTVCIDNLTAHIDIKSSALYYLSQFALIKPYEVLSFQMQTHKPLRRAQPA